jgi:transmembrane sensor
MNLIPPERLAEAGVWIARLHGDERDRDLEKGFRQWLRADAMNAKAFEIATEVWELAPNLRRIVPFASDAPATRQVRFSFALPALAAAVSAMLLMVIAAVLYLHSSSITTGVGEQRSVTLNDGTRIYLNTATRVVVSYDKHFRKVELTAGEALFDVAKRPDWPFIVTAGDRQVRALGTSFVVRREDHRLAVTLVEGTVSVSSLSGDGSPVSAEPNTVNSPLPKGKIFTLTPGQQLTFTPGKAPQLDVTPLDKATAWRRGEIILNDTPLREAVAEMNRYSMVKLTIERVEAADMPVTGLFQAGDSTSFAQAVSQTYGLRTAEHGAEIVLLGIPKSAELPLR